ncbi:capsular polysaccharide synthesis protein [Sphingobacterium corticis]|uniref:Capsular polysaccharide synthesis protein n=1 Tax=Sphingobacterium corticis TaxID=1812823 RepID=A0ABW5NJU8_9SPHI
MKKVKNFFANGVLSKKIWALGKRKLIRRKQDKIARFWNPIIDKYFAGNLPIDEIKAKADLKGKTVVWQYWGQGMSGELPELVKICFSSVDKYCSDYTIIRLDDSTIQDYIDFPDYVWKEVGEPKFKRVFFSDLLRLALLAKYGGVWIDATILLTGALPKRYFEMDFFVFQRDDKVFDESNWPSTDMKYWSSDPDFKVRMLTSIMFAKSNNELVSVLLAILLYYWKTQTRIRHYFILQILYHELITGRLQQAKPFVESDTYSHLLRMLVDGHENVSTVTELLATTHIHKLTYLEDEPMSRFRRLLRCIEEKDF